MFDFSLLDVVAPGPLDYADVSLIGLLLVCIAALIVGVAVFFIIRHFFKKPKNAAEMPAVFAAPACEPNMGAVPGSAAADEEKPENNTEYNKDKNGS